MIPAFLNSPHSPMFQCIAHFQTVEFLNNSTTFFAILIDFFFPIPPALEDFLISPPEIFTQEENIRC